MKNFFKQHKLLVIVLPLVLILCGALIAGVIYINRMRQARTYVEEGDRYLAELNYEQAIICYQQAVNIDERNRGANLGLAECYEVGGQNVYAESIYRSMLEHNPKDEDVYPKLAELLIRTDKPEEAQELMAQAVAYIRNNETIDDWYLMTHPTVPAMDQTPGSFDTRIQVALTADEGDIIYYTTDGSDPTDASNVYTGPLVMRNGQNTVRAIAVNSAGFSSTIIDGVYHINIADVEIQVQDPVIEEILRKELDIWNEPIYNDDIAQVTSLYIIGSSAYHGIKTPVSLTYPENGTVIAVAQQTGYVSEFNAEYQKTGTLETLADLQYMPFLHTLNIYGQTSLDISAIALAPSLEDVSLLACDLTSDELSPIAQLPNIRKLALGWNAIETLDALKPLTGLVSLGIWGNAVADVSPIQPMSSLEVLDISNNSVSDISPVSSLQALRELWMYNNRVATIAPVQKLTSLQVLMVRNNPIADPEAVRPIYPNLTRIDTDLLGLADNE